MSFTYFPDRNELFLSMSIEASDLHEDKYIPVHADLLRQLIRYALASVKVSEESYRRYPDIAQAFDNNEIEDPVGHYLDNGYMEGRTVIPDAFDEGWYLESYKDVKRLIEQGEIQCAEDHYLNNGIRENRAYSEKSREEAENWRLVFELSRQG